MRGEGAGTFVDPPAVERYDHARAIDDPNSAVARVVRLVGRERRVLEVGAGAGAIARWLRETQGCEVAAVEIDPACAARLATWCRPVHQLDLDDPRWVHEVRTQSPPFQTIVAADVLEHLRDPWRTMADLRSLLDDEGELVLSIPHAGHGAVIAALMRSDVDYHPTGLLDRTHLRFFGLRNMQALVEDAGLRIVHAEFVSLHPADTELADHWRALDEDAQSAILARPFSAVYQVVLKARVADRRAGGMDLLQAVSPGARRASRIARGRRFVGSHLPPTVRYRLRSLRWPGLR